MGDKRLNQIVAIEQDVKSRAYGDVSKEHHVIQKQDVVSGFSKVYSPVREDGEMFPPESKRVQTRVKDALTEVHGRLRDLWDLRLTKDTGNLVATADIIVDGMVVHEKVPVTSLLFLEKQLQDIHTFLTKLPVLPADDEWMFDAGKGHYVTAPSKTHKTAKVQKPIVLYAATQEHPAQTQLIVEDVTIGHWTTVKHSGAIPSDRRRELVARCEKLQNAVKDARERANMVTVSEHKIADKLFGMLFAD